MRSCRPGRTPSSPSLLLLAVVLRRVRDVVLTMLPVLLSGLLTFATCAALDLPLNFTNIIALPLLFGIGVAFKHLFRAGVGAAGETAILQVEPDARRRLQRAGDGHRIRRLVAVEPSRYGEHGPAADDFARLGASRDGVVPAGAARVAPRRVKVDSIVLSSQACEALLVVYDRRSAPLPAPFMPVRKYYSARR